MRIFFSSLVVSPFFFMFGECESRKHLLLVSEMSRSEQLFSP